MQAFARYPRERQIGNFNGFGRFSLSVLSLPRERSRGHFLYLLTILSRWFAS
jgi:hypothetical protein